MHTITRGRTPPGVRELKLGAGLPRPRGASRTPPGVRELKQAGNAQGAVTPARRTPPGVRELKPLLPLAAIAGGAVAPLPGCVN